MDTEGGGRSGAALILHKTPNIEVRTNDDTYFENFLITYQDSPFPLIEDRKTPVEEVIDIWSDNEGDPEDEIALFFNPRLTTPSKGWAVIWGRGNLQE